MKRGNRTAPALALVIAFGFGAGGPESARADDDQNSPWLDGTTGTGPITAVPPPGDPPVPPKPPLAVTCAADPVGLVPEAQPDGSDCPYAGEVLVDLFFTAVDVAHNFDQECGKTFQGKLPDYQEIVVRYSGMAPQVGLPAMALELSKKTTKDVTRCTVRAAIESLSWSRESRDAWKRSFDAIMELQDAQDLLKKLGSPSSLSLDEQNRLSGLLDRKVYERLVKGADKYASASDKINKFLESLAGDEAVSEGALGRSRSLITECEFERAALELGVGLASGSKALASLRAAIESGQRDLFCIKEELRLSAPDKLKDPLLQMPSGPAADDYRRTYERVAFARLRAAAQEDRLRTLATVCADLKQAADRDARRYRDYEAAARIAGLVTDGESCDFAGAERAVSDLERMERDECGSRLGTLKSVGLGYRLAAAKASIARIDQEIARLGEQARTLLASGASCSEVEETLFAIGRMMLQNRCADAFAVTASSESARSQVDASRAAARDARAALSSGQAALQRCDDSAASQAATRAEGFLRMVTCAPGGAPSQSEVAALAAQALAAAGRLAALQSSAAAIGAKAEWAAVTCDRSTLQALADELSGLVGAYAATCPESPQAVRAALGQIQRLLKSAENTVPARAAIAAARAAIQACDSGAARAAIAQLRELGSACGIDLVAETSALEQELKATEERLDLYEPTVMAAADQVDAAVARCDLAAAERAMAELKRIAERTPCPEVPPVVARRVHASFQKVEVLKQAGSAITDLLAALDQAEATMRDCPPSLVALAAAVTQIEGELLPRATRLAPGCDLGGARSRLRELRSRREQIVQVRADVNAKLVMLRGYFSPASQDFNAKVAKDLARQRIQVVRAMAVPEECFMEQLRELDELWALAGSEAESGDEVHSDAASASGFHLYEIRVEPQVIYGLAPEIVGAGQRTFEVKGSGPALDARGILTVDVPPHVASDETGITIKAQGHAQFQVKARFFSWIGADLNVLGRGDNRNTGTEAQEVGSNSVVVEQTVATSFAESHMIRKWDENGVQYRQFTIGLGVFGAEYAIAVKFTYRNGPTSSSSSSSSGPTN